MSQDEQSEQNDDTKVFFFRGEHDCQMKYKNGGSCNKKALYSVMDGEKKRILVCGQHKSKGSCIRNLVVNPCAAKNKEDEILKMKVKVEEAKDLNVRDKKKGDVKVSKFGFQNTLKFIDGYRCIFPNAGHANKKEGVGLPALSPMKLGPVDLHMKGLGPSLNLENAWQFAKVYPSEVDEDGELTPEYWEDRQDAHDDKIAHRHKPTSKNGSVKPLYTVYGTENGDNVKFDYVQSRRFYCHHYAELAKATTEFDDLKKMINDGYNINIYGYDGYPITKPVYEHYVDGSEPFGHERVLYCLLTIDDEEKYPWNMYAADHPELYEGFTFE